MSNKNGKQIYLLQCFEYYQVVIAIRHYVPHRWMLWWDTK